MLHRQRGMTMIGIIVLIAVVLLTAFVASLDWIFGQFVLKLFNQ